MGTYNSAVITNGGQSMIAQAVAGASLEFTTIKTSNYAYPAGTNLATLTTISGIKQSKDITSATVYNSRVIKISAAVDNTGISTAYTINTIGIYAKVGSSAESLFAVVTASAADTMPAYDSKPYSYIYEINLTMQNAANVTVTVNAAGLVNVEDLNAAKVEIRGEIADLKSEISYKVNIPLDNNNQPTNGTNGQTLRTKGDGSTEWAEVGLPSDEQTSNAVSNWLNAHPEATTTVQDDSITEEKFNLTLKRKLAYTFNTCADMKASTALKTGQICRTLGYYAANDGGGALYQMHTTAPTGYSESITNGLHAELIVSAWVSPEMYGAKGDGTTDDTAALNAAFASGKTVVIAKPYLASNDITIATDVIGTSAGKLTLGKNVWIQTAGVNISGVTFDGNDGCGFVRVRANDVCINECNFINFADIADYKYCVALLVGESNTHFTGINVTKCFFDGAKTYYDDGTQGNQTGTVRQLLIDRADCNVDHCTFMNLSGYTDGDNIHVRGAEITSGLIYPQSVSGYKADYQKVVITNNLILMSNKSAIKNQCSGTIMKNNTIIVSSSTQAEMHSAIRSMASDDVKIIGNIVRHLSGTLTNVYTVEYGKRCIVSENALEGAASTLSYIFRLVDNTEITVSGNNVQTVSSASFEYGCYNSGIVSDNAFDCGVTLDGYVSLFDEKKAESSPPTNDQTLIIRGNTFKCSGSLRQFWVLFQYSVDLEIKDNTVIGTFTNSAFCQYRIYLVDNVYSKVRLYREMLDNAVNINISQSSDSRTKQIACTIEDSPVTKVNAYNCASLKLKNCAIGKFNSTPIDIYSSAAVDIDGCDCRNITAGFISIHSATPTFELSNNVIRLGFNSEKLFVSDNSYNLSGVKWHKNNASSLGNVDYTFAAANILGFVFDAGAICYNNSTGGALVYFNGAWHSLAAA